MQFSWHKKLLSLEIKYHLWCHRNRKKVYYQCFKRQFLNIFLTLTNIHCYRTIKIWTYLLLLIFIPPLYCPKWILKQYLATLDFHTFLSYICRFFLHLQICSDVFGLNPIWTTSSYQGISIVSLERIWNLKIKICIFGGSMSLLSIKHTKKQHNLYFTINTSRK